MYDEIRRRRISDRPLWFFALAYGWGDFFTVIVILNTPCFKVIVILILPSPFFGLTFTSNLLAVCSSLRQSIAGHINAAASVSSIPAFSLHDEKQSKKGVTLL